MGFESKISGYIASHKRLWDEDAINQIESIINTLPNLENDKWPFLPKDIFAVSKPISKDANPVQISYRSAMIHFSMSVKQIEDDLQEWINKFESFFKQIPGVYEVNVDIHLSPYTGKYKNENLNYNWKAKRDKDGIVSWRYKGDPTTLEDICKPVYFAHSYFTEKLRLEVIQNMQWLATKVGEVVKITDRISTVKGNYNRHFTRTNRIETTLNRFGIRTSGAIATIEGNNIEFEFKIDSIRRIIKDGNKLEIEIAFDMNTSRLINLEVKEQGDNM